MKFGKHILIALSLSLTGLVAMDDAKACGGCFVQQSENTQVSGHRMILSVSQEQTTLWDQITYDGAPESFAWVLPIRGTVEVGLSSDALFQVLESYTNVVVSSPTISCPNSCNNLSGSEGSGGGGGEGGGGGVTILDQEVVGPYETVQLSASDPGALTNWLSSHGYSIPASIQPVIDSYVSENFNFLALKLVPGQGVAAMRPVRITTPGAGPALPLRMVAAGTGAKTPILLWVFGEGRYEPTNFSSFTIKSDELVWNWNTSSSNYAQLKQQKLDAANGKGWLIEAAGTLYSADIGGTLEWGGGLDEYADADGANAEANLASDMDALYGKIPGNTLFSTRMFADLPQSALTNDLSLGASADQNPVSNYLYTETTVGTPPECPPDPCGEENGGGSNWFPGFGSGGAGSGKTDDNGSPGGSGGCGVSMTGQAEGMGVLGIGLAAAIAMLRRRRSRKS